VNKSSINVFITAVNNSVAEASTCTMKYFNEASVLYMFLTSIKGMNDIRCDARHHPHCTHDLRSGSQDHHPSKNSVQKTIRCNSTSNAPDDGRMYPKHVELRIHQ